MYLDHLLGICKKITSISKRTRESANDLKLQNPFSLCILHQGEKKRKKKNFLKIIDLVNANSVGERSSRYLYNTILYNSRLFSHFQLKVCKIENSTKFNIAFGSRHVHIFPAETLQRLQIKIPERDCFRISLTRCLSCCINKLSSWKNKYQFPHPIYFYLYESIINEFVNKIFSLKFENKTDRPPCSGIIGIAYSYIFALFHTVSLQHRVSYRSNYSCSILIDSHYVVHSSNLIFYC